MKIPITKPYYDDCERENVLKPLETGWLVQGPYVREFERMFAEYTAAKHAKATSSCTTALHLVLEAMEIKTGDKVIVPSFTYIASANAVETTGAEVVICDVDLRTLNVTTAEIERVLAEDKENRIKAIMPINLFGLCAPMPEIMELAAKHDLKVLEDSACGLGALIDGKHSGTFGDAGCFSFHPRKSLTTGEGGMIITNDDELFNQIIPRGDHGASKSDLARHKEKGGSLLPDFNYRGFNYRMTDMQGALGVCQMKKADYIFSTRRELAKRYDDFLRTFDGLYAPYIPNGYTHGYQAYVCLFTNGEDLSSLSKEKVDRLNQRRNAYMERLEEKGISTRQGTHAVHTLGYYKNKHNFKDEDFLNSYAADRLTIAIPLFTGMTDEEFDYVVKNLKELM